MIEALALTRRYGGRVAVRELSFAVRPGEVVGLLGPNGAGKTTTLRMLAGVLRPSNGTARISGHDIVAEALAAKRRLAFVPDEPRFFDYLTVEEHLRFVARVHGVRDVEPHLQHLAEHTTVGARLAAFPSELSRGTCILLSSHLLHLVAELCERIVLLREGQSVAQGTIADLARDRALEGRPLEELFVSLLTDQAP